ncbi:MAG: FAD-binding oxidoreductase [Parachlamydiaceae bacterium]|nr:FAD-binding oxidoreductase [Parachlamydiaceae bacterium]
MKNNIEEKPGVMTPWAEINHLLTADERFEIIHPNFKNRYLFAPKNLSRLSALLFLLEQKGLDFNIIGLGNSVSLPIFEHQIFLTVRALNQIHKISNSVVEVEAGCDLRTLQSTLMTYNCELGFEDWIWKQNRATVGSALIRGCSSGLCIDKNFVRDKLLGIHIAKLDGSLVECGRGLEGAKAGPLLHKLVYGIEELGGILTKCYFCIRPIPNERLYLYWDFNNTQMLWDHFKSLQAFTNTWERLDVIISGNLAEKGFILAQISGTSEEMVLFKQICPRYESAHQKDMISTLKTHLKAYYYTSVDFTSHLDRLLPAEYIWYHSLEDLCWILTEQSVHEKNNNETKFIWKSRLRACFSNIHM